MEQLVVYFSSNWYPAAGLSPTVNIRERNGTVRVLNGLCKQIPNAVWFYSYDFQNYDQNKQYLFRFDWTGVLPQTDRWISWVNDLDSYENKISRWRTAAPLSHYTSQLDNIEKKFLEIPKYDDTKVIKSIEKLEKMIPKEKKEEPNPVLIELTDKIKSIEKLIWTMWSNEEIIALQASLDMLKDKLSTEIQNIWKISNEKSQEIKIEISQLPEKVITKGKEVELQDSDEEILWELDNIEKQDQEVLTNLHNMEIDDNEVLNNLSIKD